MLIVARMNAQTITPLSRAQAAAKYDAACSLRLHRSTVAEWRRVFPDAASLETFRREVGGLSWPDNWGQSPWEDAFSVACQLGNPMTTTTIGHTVRRLGERDASTIGLCTVLLAYGFTLPAEVAEALDLVPA